MTCGIIQVYDNIQTKLHKHKLTKFEIINKQLHKLKKENVQNCPITDKTHHKCNSKFINFTFTDKEIQTLENDRKTNLKYISKNCIKNLIVETKTAITSRNASEQDNLKPQPQKK